MTTPKHNRFVVRGIFGTTDEIWSYSLKFTSVVTAGSDVLPQDWNASAVTAAVNAFHSSSMFHTGCKVVGWRGYQIGADGNTTDDGNNLKRNDYATPVAGTGSNIHPPQIALVVSTIGASRGPAQFGRAYMPGISQSVDANTQTISPGAALSLGGQFKTLVEALKNAMYPVTVVGESLINVSSIGTGHTQDVKTYRVGRVFDTMRSRRNKLLEDYQDTAA